MEQSSTYMGSELDLFSSATNWKNYWSSSISKFIRGDVLEVGAGIGGNLPYLLPQSKTYTLLEPDAELVESMKAFIKEYGFNKTIMTRIGTLCDLNESSMFDTIVYIDVLEHIENDKEELTQAAKHLRLNGHLVVLCPAHQALFSPFDEAIGHFRRYSKKSLSSVGRDVESLTRTNSYYLDSVGLAASLANKLFLRQSEPKPSQINFWDRTIIPCSRIVDKVCFRLFGKTVITVWKKNNYYNLQTVEFSRSKLLDI